MNMEKNDLRKVTTHLVLTGDIGMSGNLYGGKLMYWMDEAAAIYAMWAAADPKVVTRRFSEIEFARPIRNGSLVEFYCGRPRKGHTSISFDVEVYAENELKFHASCTFVRVDADGMKKAIDWSASPLDRENAGQ